MGGRYYKFSDFLQQTFGEKVRKISLDAGFYCPNKQNGRRGCVFCRNDSFSPNYGSFLSLEEQLKKGMEEGRRKGINKFIAYFQAGSNTFAPVERLRQLFTAALCDPAIVGISIATRPDCLQDDVISLLKELASKTVVWVELGLQSNDDAVLQAIGRGHSTADYINAVERLAALPVRICAHLMFGLPLERETAPRETARLIAQTKTHEVKVHPLLILKDTPLEEMYRRGDAKELEMSEYVRRVCDFLEHVPPSLVIQRLTAEAPREVLISPKWALQKLTVLQSIDRELAERGSCQGSRFTKVF